MELNKHKFTHRQELNGRNSIGRHRLTVYEATGKFYKHPIVIHHIDENKENNSNTNLVVCPDQAYHLHIHYRQSVLDDGYHPDVHNKCTDCEEYKLHEDFSKNKTRASGLNNICKSCASTRNRERYKRGL